MIQIDTWKRRAPAGDGTGAVRSIDGPDYTMSGTEAIQRLQLVQLAHRATHIVAIAICELRQNEGRLRLAKEVGSDD